MGSLILFILGIGAPLAVAVVVMWLEDRRRARLKSRFDRLAQDNRGLKLALGTNRSPATADAGPDLPANVDKREVARLMDQLARDGILEDWLRLGARAPAEAAARLKGTHQTAPPALEQAIAEWGSQGVLAALDRLKERLAAVAEMEMVLADPHVNPAFDANAMLDRTLWVFEPEYLVTEGELAIDPRFGAVSKPAMAASLNAGQGKDGTPTLVVELKNARVTIGADQQLQAWSNVRELIRGGAVNERDPVDVFVVGGAVDEFDGNPRVEGRYRNVRITSYDYGQLIARAKRLTFGLYDELRDTAPFLRRHREEIAAGQRAAVERAADEAAAAHAQGAGDHVRHIAEDAPVRHETYADAPRRGEVEEPMLPPVPGRRAAFREASVAPPPEPPRAAEPRHPYDGDHVVIGRRKDAAQ
jgi:hypothetical protein